MPKSPKDLLDFLVKNIVSDKESVTISEETDQYGGIVLNLTVSKEDMGKIIGKGGKTIRAIRNLVKNWSIKNSVHAIVNLTEEY